MKKNILMIIVGLIVGVGIMVGTYFLFFNKEKIMKCPECEKCKECDVCEEKECSKFNEEIGLSFTNIPDTYYNFSTEPDRGSSERIIISDKKVVVELDNEKKKELSLTNRVINAIFINNNDGPVGLEEIKTYILEDDGSVYSIAVNNNYDIKINKISGNTKYIGLVSIDEDIALHVVSECYAINTLGQYVKIS